MADVMNQPPQHWSIPQPSKRLPMSQIQPSQSLSNVHSLAPYPSLDLSPRRYRFPSPSPSITPLLMDTPPPPMAEEQPLPTVQRMYNWNGGLTVSVGSRNTARRGAQPLESVRAQRVRSRK